MNNLENSIKDAFNEDVKRTGSYTYTKNDKLSCRYANERINHGITEMFSFDAKSILDLGCGDGTYSLEFAELGAESLLGVDLAEEAVRVAQEKADRLNLSDKVRFKTGDVYNLNLKKKFDCVVFSRILHHLSGPKLAIKCATQYGDTLLIIEPNGANPVLKIIEKYSAYHKAHGEKSYRPGLICSWIKSSGFTVKKVTYVNLVPMFCPDWMAKICRFFTPLVEKIPLLRNICCGQVIILAEKL